MYPGFLRFPDGHRLRVGVGASFSANGKRVAVDDVDDEAVGFK
jgi:hypothetical protein